MMKSNYFFFLLILVGLHNSASAQMSSDKYEQVDLSVNIIGPLNHFNLATITDTITQKFDSKAHKSRAIFSWIAKNIALDPKLTKNNESKNTDPEQIIQVRKTSPLGIAKLFQEMASQAGIRCLIVDGYTKSKSDNINNKEDETNYTWNVVQLGTSPNEWYYVDAAKGCGNLDFKQTTFTPAFNPEYFFPDKYVFNLDHFAKNTAWLLGEGPKSIKDFYGLPLIQKGAYEFELSQATPSFGFIKAKLNTPFKFTFKFKKQPSISDISISFGEGIKETLPERINFEVKDGELFFYYKFKKEDTTPFSIMINGKKILTYLTEVAE